VKLNHIAIFSQKKMSVLEKKKLKCKNFVASNGLHFFHKKSVIFYKKKQYKPKKLLIILFLLSKQYYLSYLFIYCYFRNNSRDITFILSKKKFDLSFG
jgi:hypothetical protein